MRNTTLLSIGLTKALKSVVQKTFRKRGFDDSFSEEELEKIKEIDIFLRRLNMHKASNGDERIKYLCISCSSRYVGKEGIETVVFYNHYLKQKDYDYEKIPLYLAKCIYRLCMNRHIEVYFAVNTFRACKIKDKLYLPSRRRENLHSSCALYTDIDLPVELVGLSNIEILNLLKKDFQELFRNVQPSYMVRSGAGVHIYYQLNESFSLEDEENISLYMETLRSLQKIFETYGSDARCVDNTRLLRVPYSRNRKPKFGRDGKEVSIIYKSDSTYDICELNKKLKLLQSGGMVQLFMDILDDIFDNYEYECKEIEKTDTKIKDILDEELVEVSIDSFEDIQEEKKVTAAVARLLDFKYKGIQCIYDYNDETFFQNRDMMIWLQNRDNHEGVRNTMLFFFNYNWYVRNRIRDYDTILEYSFKLNEYFKPKLSHNELMKAVKCNFYELDKRKLYKNIRNTTIQRYLNFTEEEKKICKGIYADSYDEYITGVKNKSKEYHIKHYKKRLDENGINKREQKARYKQMLIDNPLMSYKEFYEITGLSMQSYSKYKKEIGSTREKYGQKKREYHLEPFKDNPNITYEQYNEIIKCHITTYYKYRKKYFQDYQ